VVPLGVTGQNMKWTDKVALIFGDPSESEFAAAIRNSMQHILEVYGVGPTIAVSSFSVTEEQVRNSRRTPSWTLPLRNLRVIGDER